MTGESSPQTGPEPVLLPSVQLNPNQAALRAGQETTARLTDALDEKIGRASPLAQFLIAQRNRMNPDRRPQTSPTEYTPLIDPQLPHT